SGVRPPLPPRRSSDLSRASAGAPRDARLRGTLGPITIAVIDPGVRMPDPIALVPLPRSVVWSEGVWQTDDPWEGLSVGLNDALRSEEHTSELQSRENL